MSDDLRRLSKTLSYYLRHRPDELGLTLGPGGYVAVDELLSALGARGVACDRALLDEVVRSSDKQRFGFDETGALIRANQGHSTAVDLQLPEAEPPPVLYHGTVAAALPEIRAGGLRPMARHHVHLSADRPTAQKVGQRRGAPVILTIDAAAMRADGHKFYRSENGVWLADEVPPRYVGFPEK